MACILNRTRIPFIIFTLIVLARPAWAQLSVSPTIIRFSGTELTQAVTVENTGPTEQTSRITLVNFQMLPGGRIVLGDGPAENGRFAGSLVRFSPRQLTLRPGESQIVRFQMHAPGHLPDGEYQAYILVQEIPEIDALDAPTSSGNDGLAVDLRAVFGVAIPLIIEKGDLSATASIPSARIEPLPDGRPAVALRIERSGDRSVRGDVSILADGTEIATVANVAIYVPTAYRDLVVPITWPSKLSLTDHQIEIRFREPQERPGAATAVFRFHGSGDGVASTEP